MRRTDHCDIALPGSHGFFDGNTTRSPGERPAAAAVSITMNNGFLADFLDIEPRTRCTERPEADGDPENAVDPRQDRDQCWRCYKQGGAGAMVE